MDFAKPIHPAEVAEFIAADLKARAKQQRDAAAVMLAKAEALEEAAWDAEKDADRWRQYQPAPAPDDQETEGDHG